MINRLINLKKFIHPTIRILLHKFYFNSFICFLENIVCKNKIKHFDLLLKDDEKIISNFTRSLIRHNLYEKYEFEAVKKLALKPDNLIDLGSSIGLVSLAIARNQKNKKIIMVEPVKEYLEFSKELFKNYSQNEHYFLNNAIDYSDNKIFLNKKDILDSEINYSSGVEIDKISIKEIIETFNLDTFNLIVDIEGKSFEPLFNEYGILNRCSNLIIEEKFSEVYKKEKVFGQLNEVGFDVIYFQQTRGSNIIAAKNMQRI